MNVVRCPALFTESVRFEEIANVKHSHIEEFTCLYHNILVISREDNSINDQGGKKEEQEMTA